MSQANTKKQTQAGLYDFAADPSAGAIGTIFLGVYFPAKSVITRFFVKTIIAPLSGGAATLAFNSRNTPDATLPVTPLMVANAFGAFVLNTALSGVDFNATPANVLSAQQVRMAIAGAPITAGKLLFVIEYQELDF